MIDRDKWLEIFHTLKSNKLRTFLTAFGVFWGIFMLVIMLGSGNGLQNAVLRGFDDFATNSAFVWGQTTTIAHKGFPRGRRIRFNNADMKMLREQISEIEYLAPRIEAWGGDGESNAVRGDKTGAFFIKGDYPEINYIDPCNVIDGRFINQIDIDQKRKIAVIGYRVRDELFKKGENPIGEYIKIKGVFFQVVGVFEAKNKEMNFGGEKDKTIFLPFTSLQQTYNYGNAVHYFSVTAKKNVPVSQVEEKCMKLLARSHSVSPKDKRAFGHFNLEEQYNKMQGLFLGISGLIWIVGTGTLLAGVIGVSNIMLVIIKERTKEIGIRRAIGASPLNIMSQIINEAVFLTSLAGIWGLMAGVGILGAINSALGDNPSSDVMFYNPIISFKTAILALVVLVISGALAGLLPAKRAVSIKPIDALRAE